MILTWFHGKLYLTTKPEVFKDIIEGEVGFVLALRKGRHIIGILGKEKPHCLID
jgi:hypothetical protein